MFHKGQGFETTLAIKTMDSSMSVEEMVKNN